MHPVFFELFGLQVHSFGAMVALAFLVGVFWAMRRAESRGIDPEMVLEAGFWIIIAAMVGARLTYILFFPQQFFANPMAILLGQGGLVWYGGLGGAILALVLYSRWRGLGAFQLTDLLAPSAALGLAIGRIGCLLAGCCYGAICQLPWAIHYPHPHPMHGVGVHPSPMYETVAMVVVTVILVQVHRMQAFSGLTSGLFLVFAGLVRFILEYFRGDRLVWLESLNLSASQCISLAIILAGVIVLAVRYWSYRRQHAHSDDSQTAHAEKGPLSSKTTLSSF